MSKKIDSVKMDFAALAERWLVSIAQGLKESTLTHYDYTLHRYILPVFGKLKLSSIDEQRLEHGMLEVIAPQDGSHKPLGASSARECLTMLRRICKYAAHLRLMRPVEVMIKLPQFEQDQTKPFSTQEQKTVQSFVLSHPTPRKVGLLLQMQLGLRIGEVCGLQWSDFDLEADVLTIRRTVSRIYCREGHTKVVIQTPKTRSSGRDIPLPKELVALLRQLRGEADSKTWFLSGNAEKTVEPRCYRKSIQIYLRQASVREVHPHVLRHTFATTCLQAGCDIKTLSEILGHADPTITLRRYVHSDLDTKRRELEHVFSVSWTKEKLPVCSKTVEQKAHRRL